MATYHLNGVQVNIRFVKGLKSKVTSNEVRSNYRCAILKNTVPELSFHKWHIHLYDGIVVFFFVLEVHDLCDPYVYTLIAEININLP